ncbi:MAG: hypothetical protein JRH01_13925 [Deltaproteobacteria bacterium]|nr:hypothetical protein [Deltaproteobacteria bacterium]MBW2395613.1 hypothetical protein [Deltaproteobacteria bacterium]
MRVFVPMVCSLLLVFAAGAPLAAQTTQQVIAKAAADAEKKAIIATAMDLTEEEAAAFWPVYDEFQDELGKLHLRKAELLRIYAETWRSLDDETARGLLAESLDIDKDRSSLRNSYLKRFRRVLSEVKVLRYYQLENKLHATVQFGLAEKVPLAP